MKHERNNLMKRSLEKWGRAPIIFEGSSTHLLEGHEHPPSKGAQALIVQRQLSREQVSKCKMDMKEISS